VLLLDGRIIDSYIRFASATTWFVCCNGTHGAIDIILDLDESYVLPPRAKIELLPTFYNPPPGSLLRDPTISPFPNVRLGEECCQSIVRFAIERSLSFFLTGAYWGFPLN
jgi:hypothetical protein